VLGDRIIDMRATADPQALARLEGFLTALAAAARPWSTLNWLGCGAGAPVLMDLLRGRLELSHGTLDAAGPVGVYLRGAFVEHGALAPRAEHEALTATIQRELDRLPVGEDRTHLHAYARWQVVHNLAARERRGATTVSSQKYSRTCLHVAADLLCWLHEQNLTLSDLRQRHLDEWVCGGRTTRTLRIRPFLAWAWRGKLTPALDAPIGYKPTAARSDDAERRLTILQRLLGDQSLDPRDRLAGALVLLFAQPITRLVRLTPHDVQTDRDTIRVRLGREPVELPEPLGRLAMQLASSQHGLATTAAAGRSPWLFPGLRLDAPLSAEHMRRRLARLGITARPDRTATLVDLCQHVPPAILADLLGISEHNAAYWTKLSGGEWARYAANRALEEPPSAGQAGRRSDRLMV
jgi:integrase